MQGRMGVGMTDNEYDVRKMLESEFVAMRKERQELRDRLAAAITELRNKPKLFVWTGVLKNYRTGVMFAYAHNVDDARQMLIDQFFPDGKVEKFYQSILDDIMKEPAVYTTPHADFLGGSE